jgi:SAM-dependent methyltransferase
MTFSDELPEEHLRLLESLEPAYLQHDDPIRQSGFSGGAERWRAERSPILDAIDHDGDLLDVGCANGYLLECLVAWAKERGITLTPFGVDMGTELIQLARQRLPQQTAHFWIANAWNWEPPRRFRYVYALYDSVPETHLAEYARRLLERAVATGGRLILGAYGSRSRQTPPFDIETFLGQAGFEIAGTSQGGDPIITRFVWIDKT